MELESVTRLSKDIRKAAETLTDAEARFLVDSYYSMQRDRIGQDSAARQIAEAGEPNQVLVWLGGQSNLLENQIKGALEKYTTAHPVGSWMKSIKGIGPVLSAGLLAHIDIAKAPTVGHIWRFAGLDPSNVWGKGEKRPWNATLKTVCWKIGESFVKVSTGENPSPYGLVYRDRKAFEIAKNDAGDYADQAAKALATKKFVKGTPTKAIYETGKLPPSHIQARCQRYATKLFLAHLHHVWWETSFGEPPAKPYVITHLGHAHYIGPPNWPVKLEP